MSQVLRMPRALLALLAALVFAVPASVPARADLVYVLNSGEASISVIDSTTRAELRRIPVLREPHHLILSPDGRDLLVGDSGGNEMLYLDPEAGELVRRERISNPYHLEVTPDGRLMVITSLRRNQVDIYEYPAMQLVQRLRVPEMPSHIAYSPDSRFVYVTLQGARALMAIDLQERRPVWSVDVGPQPAGVLWHNDRLLVGTMGSDHIVVVDPHTQRVERTVLTARGSHTVWRSPDGKTIYATSRVDSRITLLEPDTLQYRTSWEVPGGPDDIAFAPDGKLWVTLRWKASVAIIDPATGAYETIRVGRSPHGIYVHPSRPAPPAVATVAPAVTVSHTATPVAPEAMTLAYRTPAEPPPPEAPRLEAPRLEAVRLEAVRIEAPRLAEPAPGRVDAASVGAQPPAPGDDQQRSILRRLQGR